MWYNIVIGYLVIINVLAMIFMYCDMKKFIKLKNRDSNFIYIIISILGGFVGVLVSSQMFGFKSSEKIMKIGIPLIAVVEVVIAAVIWLNVNGIEIDLDV